MADFATVLGNIAKGLADLSTLEVVTYKGKIDATAVNISLSGDMMGTVLQNAKTNANFKLLACTYFELDADTTVFFDEGISVEERTAHQALVDAALAKRDSIITLFKDAIVKGL
jgi:hypothetical protein